MTQFKILVVEDDDAIRGMLVMVLEQAGYLPIAGAGIADKAQKLLDDLMMISSCWIGCSLGHQVWNGRGA